MNNLPSPEKLHHPHLKQLATQLTEATHEAEAIFSELSPARLTWKPAPKVWSAQECFEHLIIAARLYEPALRVHIEKRRAAGDDPAAPYKPTWFGRWFVGMLRPEAARKISTTSVFMPTHQREDPTLHARFLEVQAELGALLVLANGVGMNGARMRSPASALVRLTLGEALELLIVHEKRHLQQIRRLQALPEFPAE